MPLYYRVAPPIPLITDGLILHLDAQNISSYPESGNQWYDLTENINTASLQNITFATGSYGQKYFNFNGSNSVAIIPEKSNFNTQTVSVEIWARSNTLNQSGFLFEKGNVNTQYSVLFEGTNLKWRMILNGGMNDLNVDSSVIGTTDEFVQIVTTYSSGVRKIYINGSVAANDSAAGTISTNTNGISIGAYGGFNGTRSYYYNGSISTVRVYNKQLSDAEVLQNFNSTGERYYGRIVGYVSGSSTFTTPDLTDSFEFSDNWNDTVNLPTATSGSSTFTTPDLTDSFEFSDNLSDNWNDTVNLPTATSGSSTFTTPDLTDSFESGDGW